MSKAEELAKRLRERHDGLYGKDAVPSVLTEAAAHLRALDASHQRLLEALSLLLLEVEDGQSAEIITKRNARAAIKQAKELS